MRRWRYDISPPQTHSQIRSKGILTLRNLLLSKPRPYSHPEAFLDLRKDTNAELFVECLVNQIILSSVVNPELVISKVIGLLTVDNQLHGSLIKGTKCIRHLNET